MTKLAFEPALSLARKIREKDISAVELLEFYLQRVEQHNPALNAIIFTQLEKARQRAQDADAALSRGEHWGPLHGVPMTIKDSFDWVGSPSTWGNPKFKDNYPERDTETAMAGPTRLMTGAFDPAFLFVVLFPLVIIALSYELLSGERERGTLAMLLSQPVTQQSLVLGKAGARALALCLVTFAFAFLGLLIAGADLSSDDAWLHVGLYALVLVAWALFWFAAAVAVNAWGQSSASNALMLVGLWLVLVVVVPGLVHVAVDALAPPPSKIELLHEAREAGQDVERKLAGIEGRHDVDTTTKGYARKVVDVQEELAKRSAPVVTALREQVAKRQAMVDTLRFLSPAIVTQLALEDVAGSGATRHQRFEAQVDAYHERFREFFFAQIRAGEPLGVNDLEAVPQLTFEEEPAGALAQRVLTGALGLLFATLLLIGLAWPGLRRVGRLTR